MATHVYSPLIFLVMSMMTSCLQSLTVSPSGETQWRVGRGSELEPSQLKYRVSPSLTVVSPLIRGRSNASGWRGKLRNKLQDLPKYRMLVEMKVAMRYKTYTVPTYHNIE